MQNWKKLLTIFGAIAIIAIVSQSFGLAEKNQDTEKTSIQSSSIESQLETDLNGIAKFFSYTGFNNVSKGHIVMIFIGLFFIFLAIKYDYEPLLLIPIGFGVLIGNIPFLEGAGLRLGIYEQGSVLNYLYKGVTLGIYPPLIFLGIGAMTDFSSLISNPKLMLLGADLSGILYARILFSIILIAIIVHSVKRLNQTSFERFFVYPKKPQDL